jgi:hypothetical protein
MKHSGAQIYMYYLKYEQQCFTRYKMRLGILYLIKHVLQVF